MSKLVRGAVLLAALALAACHAPSAPPPMQLEKTEFANLPGWPQSNAGAALQAFRRSCGDILKSDPARPMGGAGYAGSYGDWQAVCRNAPPEDENARGFFEKNFAPFAVTGGAMPDGLFTGYYEPEISASRTRHGAFQTPVYGLPSDLISVDLGAFRPNLKGERIAGRVQGQTLVPYPARADIARNGLSQAPILFYAEDPVALFFLQIQGSGRARFDDGGFARIAYAGQNGQPYSAIGAKLIVDGALTRENVSLQTIRDWLKANPDKADTAMNTNASYVFFKELPLGDPSLGANGSEGVPLTPGASLAVDLRLHALGTPFYLASTTPDKAPLDALLIAQDTGGAIRGAARGDVFWGTGARAEDVAGKMKQPGKLFVLLPLAVAARLGPAGEFAGP